MVNIFLRSFKICDPEFLDKEIRYIYNSFECLGYCKYFIDQAYFKARKIFYGTNTRQTFDVSNIIILPNFESGKILKNVTDKLNLTIVNKSANSIKAQFKNKIQTYNSPSVIYKYLVIVAINHS